MGTRAFGTILQRNGVTVAQVDNIRGPETTLETVDATHHTSTGGWREFIATLLSGGEVSFDGLFLPADATHSYAAGLLYDQANRVLQVFTLQCTDAGTTTASFSAYVTKCSPTFPIEGAMKWSVTLKVSGPVTWA